MTQSTTASASAHATGFPAVGASTPRVLILGSLPSQASLHAGQYYAHPRNQFWRLMQTLLNWPLIPDYPQRILALQRQHIRLWDVLASAERAGSLDSAIRSDSMCCNPIASWVNQTSQLQAIACNGSKAWQLFQRHVFPDLDTPGPSCHRLPSSSPAYAAMSLPDKQLAWSVLLPYLA